MWPKAIPLRRLNACRIIHCSLGKPVALCHISIHSWAIQPLNWVWSYHKKSGESGNLWPLSSCCWGGVGAARAAKDCTFAICLVKARTSSPDCRTYRVISSSYCCNSSSVPATLGVLLASSRSSLNVSNRCSNVGCLHCGGRNCCDCRFVICVCNAIICAGWSHTVSTMAAGSVYCAGITARFTPGPDQQKPLMSSGLINKKMNKASLRMHIRSNTQRTQGNF